MFTIPIRWIEIHNLTTLKEFSERIDGLSTQKRQVFCQNNGQIVYIDENGFSFVTPYRTEIHELLRSNGYKEDSSLSVPYSNSSKFTARYQWLKKMADHENWAKTHDSAHKVAESKGIQPIEFKCNPKHYKYREITHYYEDGAFAYTPMVMPYLFNDTDKNIGTFILVNTSVILVCDEYGRTFLITTHTQSTFNYIANALLSAKYSFNSHPESFVSEKNTLNETSSGDEKKTAE